MGRDFRNIIFVAIIALFFLQMYVSKEDAKQEQEIKNKKIVTLSTFVLYDIAKHISEDTFELVRMIPPGVDIHAYEPSPKVMAKVEASDLIIYNGAGLEPWLSSFDFKDRSIAIGDYIKMISLDNHDHHSHDGHQCSSSSFDPHFWFDVENMKKASEVMTDAFVKLYPQNKLMYLENRDKYLGMLEKVDLMYKEKLQNCKRDTLITNHNAFSYLSQKYAFHVESLTGLSSDSEPSPKDVIRIIETIKEHEAPVVFFENFSSSKSMKSLAKQTNVKLDSLHPLGNVTKEDEQNNRTYEDIMLSNLNKIHEALVCQ